MKNEKIAKFLKELREEKGLNMSEMGRQLGISQTAWAKMEQGKSLPSFSTLAKLWQRLNVQPHALLKLDQSTIPGKHEEEKQETCLH